MRRGAETGGEGGLGCGGGGWGGGESHCVMIIALVTRMGAWEPEFLALPGAAFSESSTWI